MPQVIQGFWRDYATNKLNDLIHKGTAFAAPAGLWLGLSSSRASRAGTLTELSSGSSPGYTRKSLVAADWTLSANGLTQNATLIEFAANSGGSDWVRAYTVFLVDASTGGNILWCAALSPDASGDGQAVQPGKKLSFAIGALVITF